MKKKIKTVQTIQTLKNIFYALHKDAGNYKGSCHAAPQTFRKMLVIDRLICPPQK